MSEKGKRAKDLLLKAAKEFENGSSPFNTEWLSKNEVTLEECGTLSDQIAIIIKGYLGLPKDEQVQLWAVGAVYGEPGIDAGVFLNSFRLNQAAAKLKKINEVKL